MAFTNCQKQWSFHRANDLRPTGGLVEVAINGRPMILTELLTRTSYVNKDEKTGFVVERKNAQQLKQAMAKTQQSPELVTKMEKMVYQLYQKLFTGKNGRVLC